MPRIRNWKDCAFLRPSEDSTYQYIEPLFKRVANWNLIKTHYHDLMRVVLSIKAGKVMPSTLLRKLGSYSKKNRLYQAFLELGKVVRTMFLLDYKYLGKINCIFGSKVFENVFHRFYQGRITLIGI
nr:transposase [Hydrococcus sp. Prado102]